MIKQAASSLWHCPAEKNQGLPEHGDVWRYRLVSGSYPQNAACQMALGCFTKCSWRARQWGVCRATPEVIWHHCAKLPKRVPNHHQLGPYKPGTFAGSAHQVNDVINLAPLLEALTREMTYLKPAIYRVKLESGLVTEDDMLPMGHYQVLPPLCPLRAETVVFGSQQGLPCGSHSIQIPHLRRQGLSTYEAILSDHPGHTRVAWSWQGVVFRGATADFPGSKVPVAACFWRM